MILWEGKSRIDGKPIVVIATIDSDNVKTGDVVHTWIVRQDVNPVLTRHTGEDYSVCGNFVHRHYFRGLVLKGDGDKRADCYVQLYQGPRAVWSKYAEGDGYACPKRNAEVTRQLGTKEIRVGAYGDPCAVPYHVWESLLAQGNRRWSGFTHQWRNPENQEYRRFLMASCDNAQDVLDAAAMGWRAYWVKYDNSQDHLVAHLPVVECLYSARGINCKACGICDGTRAEDSTGKCHVENLAHGARSLVHLKAGKLGLNVVR